MTVGLRWERIAAHEGGTVAALGAAPGGEAVFAATPAGVARSGDRGRCWEMLAAGTLSLLDAVAVSPAFGADRTAFVGGAGGLYRTDDGGDAWTLLPLPGGVTAIALSPAFAEDGVVVAGTEDDGVFVSSDRGDTWRHAGAGLLDHRVTAVALSPRFSDDHTGFAGTPTGVYRSRNGCRSWRPLDRAGEAAVECMAVSGEGTVMVGTDGDGLLISTDGGASWAPAAGIQGSSVTALAVAGTSAAFATPEGVMRSGDGGRTWRPACGAPATALSLCLLGDEPRLLAGTMAAGVLSTDGGAWRTRSTGLLGRLPGALVPSPGFDRDRRLWWYGPDRGVRMSEDGGRIWHDIGLADHWVVAVAVLSPSTLCAATHAGVYVGGDGGWRRVRPEATNAVAVDSGGVLVAALEDGEVARSRDDGRTWTTVHRFRPEDGSVTALIAVGDHVRAVTTTRVESGFRHVLWRSDPPRSQWVATLTECVAGPVALAATPDDVLVGAGPRILRIPWAEPPGAAPGPLTPLSPSGALVVHGLAARRSCMVAATTAGVYISAAGGTGLRRSEGAPAPATSVAVGGESTLFALGARAELWSATPR